MTTATGPTLGSVVRSGRGPVLVGGPATPLPEETRAELARLGVEHIVLVDDNPEAACLTHRCPAAGRCDERL